MSDLDHILTASRVPTLFGLLQFLTVIINPKSRHGMSKLLNYRNVLGFLLSGFFWKLEDAFNFRTKLRQVVQGKAVIRSTCAAHKWMVLFLSDHPNFDKSQKDAEVYTELPTECLIDGALYYPNKIEKKMEIESQHHAPRYYAKKSDEHPCSELKTEKIQRDIALKPTPNMKMHFVFQGTLFWVQRQHRVDWSGHTFDKIILTYWSLTSAPLHQLLNYAQEKYLATIEEDERQVSMYRMNNMGGWIHSKVANTRGINTLHLATDLKEEIFEDAKAFFSEKCRQKYLQRTVPWRRGYLFYGPPGCGKSTLSHVLASELGEAIYILDLGSSNIDDDTFLRAMRKLPPRCIILMEDIDVAFAKRKKVKATTSSQPESKTNREAKPVKKSSLSFSAVLNALDGVDAQDGRLAIITTNCVDKLDEALLRPGRVDKKFEIKLATQDQARELFIRWFTPTDDSNSEEVLSQAQVFAQPIPNYKFSPAELQGYLLCCDDDQDKAIQNIEGWVKEQKRDSEQVLPT